MDPKISRTVTSDNFAAVWRERHKSSRQRMLDVRQATPNRMARAKPIDAEGCGSRDNRKCKPVLRGAVNLNANYPALRCYRSEIVVSEVVAVV